MDHKMFCFQCEQTAGCAGCTGKAGVCGKTADVAKLQDELTGALIGLARVTDGDTPVNDTFIRAELQTAAGKKGWSQITLLDPLK